ncbi:MAG: methionyl-tRNA formyltransferase [Patescibacteria group bacterium]|nr:methionyl-tRNA formyltransferase [Patescibacteria group bacterium]
MAGGHKLVFFGNERLATGLSTDAPIFRSLLAEGYDIVGLVVAQKPVSPSRKARNPEIVEVAESNNVPVLAPTKLSEAVDDIKALGADIAVLVAYGKIVPQAILDIFPKGIINIHPSLLPKHRGPTPLESVILSNDSETGVSIMQLAPEMDAGPVYTQKKVSLDGTETKQALADKLIAIGKGLLEQHLPAIIDGTLEPEKQSGKPSYDQLIDKSAAILDFNKDAPELEREVRAYAGWPRSRCKIGTHDIIITQAHVTEGSGVMGTLHLDGNSIGIYAGNGILVFDKLIPPGKKEMDTHSFMAGYHPVDGFNY